MSREYLVVTDTGYRSVWTYLYKTPHRIDYLDAGGIRTRFLEAGKVGAPVVVMLHGAAGSLENFCANISAYAEHFHVFAIDMIGAGCTDKPDHPYTPAVYVDHLFGFMDAAGLPCAAFLGNGLGATVALHAALRDPDRVSRICLCSTGAIISDPEEFERFMAKVKARRNAAADAPTRESVRTIFNNLMFDPRNVIEDLVQVRLAIYRDPEMQRAMPHMFATASADECLSHAAWRNFAKPLQAIAAIDSPNQMMVRNARLIAELAPNCQLVEIPGCATWPQFEQADLFNAASIAFFAGDRA